MSTAVIKIPSISLCTLLRVSTGYETCSCIVILHIAGRRAGRGHCVTPLLMRGWRNRSCSHVRVASIIEYNLLLHYLHLSILTLLFATEHDPLPCFFEQSASTNTPDVDISHANVSHRLAHMQRCLRGVGSVFVPHSMGGVLCPIGDEILSRMLDGGE